MRRRRIVLADNQNTNSSQQLGDAASNDAIAAAPLTRRQLREQALANEAKEAREAADFISPMVSEEVSTATAALATFSKEDKKAELTRQLKRELRWAFVKDRVSFTGKNSQKQSKESASKITLKLNRGQRMLRAGITGVMVTALLATVAIPAYGALTKPEISADYATDESFVGIQSLIIDSDAQDSELGRSSYGATTSQEVSKLKEQERLAALSSRMTSSSSSSSYSLSSADLAMVAPGSGEVRWPLGGAGWSQGSFYAGHRGADYMAPEGTPVYAIATGTVIKVSNGGYGNGWGTHVQISHSIGGRHVTSLYAHMLPGSLGVSVGDTVSAGQFVGKVSDTGRAYGKHLHLEVVIDGRYLIQQEQYNWFAANAG